MLHMHDTHKLGVMEYACVTLALWRSGKINTVRSPYYIASSKAARLHETLRTKVVKCWYMLQHGWNLENVVWGEKRRKPDTSTQHTCTKHSLIRLFKGSICIGMGKVGRSAESCGEGDGEWSPFWVTKVFQLSVGSVYNLVNILKPLNWRL